ncbi:MAG: hypothetical protein P8J32_01980 [bacterium]|nr:hypothetical protein [bacterium]
MELFVITWLLIGALVSFAFFKANDRLSKSNSSMKSMQEITEKSAQDNADNPESIPILRGIIIMTLSLGATVFWPLFGVLLLMALSKK